MSTVVLPPPLVEASRRRPRPWRWLVGRLLSALAVVWAAATLTFVAMRLLPGDPVRAVLGSVVNEPTPEQRAAIVSEYGFDDPMIVQYAHYLGRILTGNFGDSYSLHQSVRQVLSERTGSTFLLMASSLVLAWAIAFVWIFVTAGRGSVRRHAGSAADILAISTPQLWLAIGLLLVFSLRLGWFPVSGTEGVGALVLPTVALAVPLAGYFGQVTREAFEHALEQPFVLTARSRGARDTAVRLKHVLRHAAIPAVTLSGFALGWLLSGAVIVETVFGRPGLGSTLLQGVLANDVSLTGAIVLISALVYVAANLVVDVVHPVIDPRTRQQT